MPIDEDAVTRYFVDLVRSKIGDQLATMSVGGVPTPAVIKTRVGKQIPDYPYVVVSQIDRVNTTPLNMHSEVGVNNLTSYTRIENLMYQFRVIGANANNITNNLHQFFDIPTVLDLVRTDTEGAIRTVSKITPLPVSIGGDYVESAYFTINWSSYNSIEDADSGLIETITLTYNP